MARNYETLGLSALAGRTHTPNAQESGSFEKDSWYLPEYLTDRNEHIAMGEPEPARASTGAMIGLLPAFSKLFNLSTDRTADQVMAYVTRLDQAWKTFYDLDLKPWTIGEEGGKKFTLPIVGAGRARAGADDSEGTLMGDILFPPGTSAKEKQKALAELEARDEIFNTYRAWKKFRDSASKDMGTFGKTPSAMWEEVRLEEGHLHAARERANKFIEIESPDPGDIANDKPFVPWMLYLGIAAGILTLGVGSFAAYKIWLAREQTKYATARSAEGRTPWLPFAPSSGASRREIRVIEESPDTVRTPPPSVDLSEMPTLVGG